MKKKVRTRLLSAVLTVAMLVSLMPAAFAASTDIDLSVDIGDEVYLSKRDVSSLSYYKYIEYFSVYDRGNNCPDMYVGNDYYTYSSWDLLDFYYFSDFNFYADSRTVDDDETYHYEIEFYNEDEVSLGTVDVYVTVGDDSYSSSSDGDIYADIDSNGYLDMDDIAEDLYYYGYYDMSKDKPESIEFTSCTNGYLYYGYSSNNYKDAEDVLFDFVNNGTQLDEYVYFEIKDDSKEAEIEFTIYGDGTQKSYGTIIVNGDSSSSAGDIKYSTEYNTSVTFDASDFEDLVPSGYELEEVSFTLPSSSKGTLYTTSSERTAVSSRDSFDYDELDEVTFAPKSGVSGDVSISFTMECYKSRSNTRTVRGTVVISIDNGATISYSCEADDYVEFDSYDFDDVCYDLTGRDLDYVKFGTVSSSKGTLYAEYTGSSRNNVAAKTSDKFYVAPGRSDYGLDDVVFVPKTSGTVEISYTAYNTKGTSFTGKVKITTTAGTLSAINYTVTGSSVTFSASDFTSALKAKTSKTLSSVTFTLPKTTEGTLYYNGTTTKVSASTQYKASGSTNTLDKVSFVPASGLSGDVTIGYTAKDTSGNTYTGTVVIKTFVGKDTVISYATTGPAATFKASDFTMACALKLNTTLAAVQFSLPSEGTLYYGFGTTQQTRVSAASKYLVGTHLNYVSFLPKAGYSGTVTIRYTGIDTAGGSYSGTIQVTVTPPTRSTVFSDATESWVAPAADFLYANGTYTGVVSGSTLGVRTNTTRGEMMQMIYNAFNLKNKVSSASITSNFTDVPTSSPYYTAINAGYALGIAQGNGDGTFSPNSAITRQDAITLLYRAFVKLGLEMTTGTSSDLRTFGDYATVSDYAVDALASMIKSGIIQGDENGNISPKGNLTRGEISVILYRAVTL